jgi:hypothetical protein
LNGDSITPCKYDRIGKFSEGLACVLLDGKVGFIDRYGNEVISLIYDGDLEEMARFQFLESKAIVKKGKKYGVIDKTGTQVKSFDYELIDPLKDGRYAAKKKGKFGFFNASGIDVIPQKYDDTWGFSEGMAAVKIGTAWGYINDANELVIPAEYDEVSDFLPSGVAVVKRGGFECLIDKNGAYLIPCSMDEIVVMEAEVLRVEKVDKMAYFDLRTGKYLWQPVGF